jgi:hypothetical protein
VARPLPFLTDAHWRSIEAAAAPHVGSDRARAEIDACLHDYCNLSLDSARLHAERERWRRIEKLARDLATQIFAIKRRAETWSDVALTSGYDPDRPPVRVARIIQHWAETRVEGLDMLVAATGGRQNPARTWLLWRLGRIWKDHFGGKLTVTTPPDGSAPYGPLVDFVLAVTAGVLDPPATGGAVKYAVRPKPKKKRRRARQLKRQGRKRRRAR